MIMLENDKYVRSLIKRKKVGHLISLIKTHKYVWSLYFYIHTINDMCIFYSLTSVIKVLNKMFEKIKHRNIIPKKINYNMLSYNHIHGFERIFTTSYKCMMMMAKKYSFKIFFGHYVKMNKIHRTYVKNINYMISDIIKNSTLEMTPFYVFVDILSEKLKDETNLEYQIYDRYVDGEYIIDK